MANAGGTMSDIGYEKTTGAAVHFAEEAIRYHYTLNQAISMLKQGWVIVHEDELNLAKYAVEKAQP